MNSPSSLFTDYQNNLDNIKSKIATILDIAIRMNLKPEGSNVQRPYSILTDHFINWEQNKKTFIFSLKNYLLNGLNKENHEIIVNELNTRLVPMINDYLIWFVSDDRQKKTMLWDDIGKVCPYQISQKIAKELLDEINSCFVKEVSESVFFTKALKKKEVHINPTHSFELLQTHRQNIFEKKLEKLGEERNLNGLDTTKSDIEHFYHNWFEEELNTIKGWLEVEQSHSNKIEIQKYKDSLTKKYNGVYQSPTIHSLESIKILNELKPQQKNTREESLTINLNKYGFFKLKKIKQLTKLNQLLLIKKISDGNLPYAIAMFDFLQFIQYLKENHFDTHKKLNQEISKWFKSDIDGRAVRGNISSLLGYTTENKRRYTAYIHKENVIKDYNQLK